MWWLNISKLQWVNALLVIPCALVIVFSSVSLNLILASIPIGSMTELGIQKGFWRRIASGPKIVLSFILSHVALLAFFTLILTFFSFAEYPVYFWYLFGITMFFVFWIVAAGTFSDLVDILMITILCVLFCICVWGIVKKPVKEFLQNAEQQKKDYEIQRKQEWERIARGNSGDAKKDVADVILDDHVESVPQNGKNTILAPHETPSLSFVFSDGSRYVPTHLTVVSVGSDPHSPFSGFVIGSRYSLSDMNFFANFDFRHTRPVLFVPNGIVSKSQYYYPYGTSVDQCYVRWDSEDRRSRGIIRLSREWVGSAPRVRMIITTENHEHAFVVFEL
jgi:hypothetical protein